MTTTAKATAAVAGGIIRIGVRVTMQGVIRHGRNMIPPGLLRAHAAGRI